jgi:hypothetical protein
LEELYWGCDTVILFSGNAATETKFHSSGKWLCNIRAHGREVLQFDRFIISLMAPDLVVICLSLSCVKSTLYLVVMFRRFSCEM